MKRLLLLMMIASPVYAQRHSPVFVAPARTTIPARPDLIIGSAAASAGVTFIVTKLVQYKKERSSKNQEKAKEKILREIQKSKR